MISKARARDHGLAIRAGISAAEHENFSKAIVERAQTGLEWSAYARVHVFLPIKRQQEIDTWPLVRWLWEFWPQIEVYVPRMNDGIMQHVHVVPATEFVVSAFGIPEPQTGKTAPIDTAFDLILTPLLGFDQAGHRVGYGGGHYDRFLAGQPGARKVGLAYVACLIEGGIAAEVHDIALDAVITN